MLLKQIEKFLGRLGYSTLDILFPPHCYFCGTPLDGHKYICSDCLGALKKVSGPVCARCGKPAAEAGRLCPQCAAGEREFFLARSYGQYRPDTLLSKAITGMKYRGERALATELGPLLNQGLTGELVRRGELITYVPLTDRKLRERGFNQAKLLARYLAQEVDLPLVEALMKTRETQPQAELGRKERRTNLKDSFAPVRTIHRDEVLLIDDVFTTGATATECSKALKHAGAKRVYVVTLARSYSAP